MDSIFHPEERCWISQEVVLGETISRLSEKAQVFFADIEKVKCDYPSLFTPQEVPRPSQEELAALLKPYDHIYEKPKKSKKKKANTDDQVGFSEPEIAIEDQDIIEVDSNSDISDSEIKLQLVSLNNDANDYDGDFHLDISEPNPNNNIVLLDSDEGEDFFEDFGQFKSTLYTKYVRDLKFKRSKRVKNRGNSLEYDNDGSNSNESSTDTDEDYEGGGEIEIESEGSSESSGEETESTDTDGESDGEIKIDRKNSKKKGVSIVEDNFAVKQPGKKEKETLTETDGRKVELKSNAGKINEQNGKNSKKKGVENQVIFGVKQPGKKETLAETDGRKVDLNAGKINNDNNGTTGGGRPRRSVAAYSNGPSVQVQDKANTTVGSSTPEQAKNEKVSTVSILSKPKVKGQSVDVNVQDGQLPGTSSEKNVTVASLDPQPGSSKAPPRPTIDKYVQDGQVAGSSTAVSILKKNLPNLPPNSVAVKAKNVTIFDEKDKGPAGPENQQDQEAVKAEIEDFKTFFENSYKVKLTDLKKSWMQEDREVFKKVYNVDNKGFEEMRNAINPSLLTIPEEFLMDSPIMIQGSMPVLCGPIPAAGSKKLAALAMLKFANIGRGLSHDAWNWKSPIVLDQMTKDQEVTDRILRTRDSKLRQGEEMRKPLGIRNPDLVEKDDFIMTISVYQNFKNDDIIADQLNLNLEPKFLYEIQVLGSQTVAELRKMLTCENDYVCLKSFDHPSQFDPSLPDASYFAKNCFDGSIICIGDKLYMDLENEQSNLMAKSVIDWGKANEGQKLGPFEKASFFDTKIKDLVIRFGYPYVFIHLGNCEHLLVFTTSKIITAEDRLERSIYPRRSEIGKLRVINCKVDNENMAKWAVIGCDRFPSSQMMICENCLLTYCYDAEGNKIGNFHLFPIINIAGKF